MPNLPEYVVAYYAILMAGKGVLPFNISLKINEIKNIAAIGEVDTIITTSEYAFALQKIGFSVIVIDTTRKTEAYEDNFVLEENSDSLAVVIPTSGTTDKPKLVMLSH